MPRLPRFHRLLLVQNKHSIRPLIDTGAVSSGSRLQPAGTINCIDDWTLLWGSFRHLFPSRSMDIVLVRLRFFLHIKFVFKSLEVTKLFQKVSLQG
ncbi:hypothetical protein HNY73_000244 [Argiope bruennichi]|uniref:Uncharacterized protein n=1 Tax=Argiope bruennichi TaxID=94029 RepID=A0A8T0FXE9_ARGBR|nr:hypothetical protein HNY73_000244 [Argiope bruennichi]